MIDANNIITYMYIIGLSSIMKTMQGCDKVGRDLMGACMRAMGVRKVTASLASESIHLLQTFDLSHVI